MDNILAVLDWKFRG